MAASAGGRGACAAAGQGATHARHANSSRAAAADADCPPMLAADFRAVPRGLQGASGNEAAGQREWAAAASAPPRRRAPTQAPTHCFTFSHLTTSISAAADRTGQLSASGAVLHLVGLAGRGAGACYDTETGCFRRCSWQLSLRLAKRGLRLAGTVRERPRPTSGASGLSNINLRSRRALAHSKQRGAPWAQHARHRRPNGRARSGDEAFWAKAAAKRPLLLIVRTGQAHAGAAGSCL